MDKEALFKLLSIPGISGYEEKISNFLKERIISLNLDYEFDNLGSIWAIKKSNNTKAKKVMIDAHMDEVGFTVTKIEDNGFIRFQEMGGVFSKTVLFQRLRVWNENAEKYYSGVVVVPGLDLTSYESISSSRDFEIEDMHLDIGASNKKEVESLGIGLGSIITFDVEPVINNNRLISKAIDNRLGVFIVYELLDFVAKTEFDYDIIIGFSVQEEVGLRGSRTSTYKFNPDLGIVVDISPANDYNGQNILGKLGEGTMLRHKDAHTVYPKVVTNFLHDVMIKNNIKYQDYISVGGTNAGIMHLMQEGRLVFPIGCLARNLHTSSSVCDLNDIEETQKLIIALLKELNSSKINIMRQIED